MVKYGKPVIIFDMSDSEEDQEEEHDTADNFILQTHLLTLNLMDNPELVSLIKKVKPHVRYLLNLIDTKEMEFENTR